MDNAATALTDLQTAHKIAAGVYGDNPPPEIVAAVLNSLTTQSLAQEIDATAERLANQINQR